MNVLILATATPALRAHNLAAVGAALARGGAAVSVADIDTLALAGGEPLVEAFDFEGVSPGAPLPPPDVTPDPVPCAGFDLVWLLGLGERFSFLDKIQLLHVVAARTRVINSPEALMFLHSKHTLPALPDFARTPRTWSGSSFGMLWSVVSAEDTRFVVKPAGMSFGRDVFVVHRDDPNARALLQNMTGHDDIQYCVLQEWVEGYASGEKRVLVAGGEVVGQYRRLPGADHRTNIEQGAAAEVCDLTADEAAMLAELGPWLAGQGAWYAGVDLVWPYVMEINVVNPGGITTLDSLGVSGVAERVAARLAATFGK